MSTKGKPVRVAAIGDLHMQETTPGRFRDLFAAVSEHADVLALCGDLTNLGLPSEAEHLAEDLKACRVPVVAVLGNHDHERGHGDEVKKVLRGANVVFLEDQVFKLRHVGFAGVKGFGGGFDRYMLASFGEEAIKHFVAEAVSETLNLERHLQSLDTKQNVVVLHYAPIAATVHGEPVEIHAFLGCSRLADAIDRYDVSAVFHGHAHHGCLEGKTTKGTPVYNCGIEVLRRRHSPHPFALIEL